MHYRNYGAAVSRYKEVMLKYPDFTKMPDTLFNVAEALRNAGNEEEAVIYYARVVTEHPLSEQTGDAKNRLVALNQPIPQPNPVALAVGMFKSRPPVPTDTGAVSDPEEAGAATDSAPAPVRGGTTGAAGSTSGGNAAGGAFQVDPKVINNKPEPVKQPD
jgi:hypothetical protein